MDGIADTLIKNPLGRVIGLILVTAVFSVFVGSINSWYTSTIDACVVDSSRFDRVIARTTNDPDDDWGAVAVEVKTEAFDAAGVELSANPTTTYTVFKQGTACGVSGTGALPTANLDVYTPFGTEATLKAGSATEAATIAGGEWEVKNPVWEAAGLGPLIRLVFQAAGLAPPLALLLQLSSFGGMFARNMMGGSVIFAIIAGVITFVVIASLFTQVLPWLGVAFNAIEPLRYVMYTQGIGTLGGVLADFFGIVIAASMLGVGWGLIQLLRGGNALGSDTRM